MSMVKRMFEEVQSKEVENIDYDYLAFVREKEQNEFMMMVEEKHCELLII